jgi:hypothetical protein
MLLRRQQPPVYELPGGFAPLELQRRHDLHDRLCGAEAQKYLIASQF